MSAWAHPERWRALISGEGCPICYSIGREGACRGTVAELESGYLTTQREQTLLGYCCLVLKRHAVELHELNEDEAWSFMRDMRRVGRTVQRATGAVKMNLEIHGNTIPHLHVHYYPRRPGDRFENGPVDPRREPLVLDEEEFARFISGLRAALREV
jgi:diadenosine tetraphosphate (Ap4A) HIT family hydrolase